MGARYTTGPYICYLHCICVDGACENFVGREQILDLIKLGLKWVSGYSNSVSGFLAIQLEHELCDNHHFFQYLFTYTDKYFFNLKHLVNTFERLA